MPAVMPMVHEDMHQWTGEDQEPRQNAKNMRGVLGQQEEPSHNKESAGNDSDRRPPPRRFLVFLVHSRSPSSALNVSAQKVVERPEHQGDVPPPDEAFDEAEKVALPAQQFKTRQKDRQCRMLHGETREQQIPRNANHVGDYEKQTEAQSEGHNGDCARLADTGLRSGPRPGHALHLAHDGTSRFHYINPMGPISSSSAVFFCSSLSAA